MKTETTITVHAIYGLGVGIAIFLLPVLSGCTTTGWSQGQSARDLGPVASQFCYLSRVAGHFQGGGEVVRVYQKNGHWWLGGASQQLGVSGQAVCIPRGVFTTGTEYAKATTKVSPDFHMAFHSGSGGSIIPGVCNHDLAGLQSYQQQVPTWNGNAATVLNGMSGKFVGGAEYAVVTQSPHPEKPSELDAGTRQCDVTMQAWAVSFLIGDTDHSELPQFIGPKGEGAMNDAGEYAVHATDSTGTAQVPMAPVGEAICYFTRIAGKFRGGGEYVEIYPAQVGQNTKTWWLRAHADNSDGVYAKVRCLKFHQP